jgi:hypothetical protein
MSSRVWSGFAELFYGDFIEAEVPNPMQQKLE